MQTDTARDVAIIFYLHPRGGRCGGEMGISIRVFNSAGEVVKGVGVLLLCIGDVVFSIAKGRLELTRPRLLVKEWGLDKAEGIKEERQDVQGGGHRGLF
ncbi:hypothetical protein MA47_01165 [Corynebacterium auriscanis]|uniref:Uncharacterized protein n=1 Tax=Corynebacterium auriscanis TaxID=99807 RepID=A0A0A2DJZ8_9CORY|nr:hypothetical protein MA47_01165 [Corynebacterium auriscanis]